MKKTLLGGLYDKGTSGRGAIKKKKHGNDG